MGYWLSLHTKCYRIRILIGPVVIDNRCDLYPYTCIDIKVVRVMLRVVIVGHACNTPMTIGGGILLLVPFSTEWVMGPAINPCRK